MPSAVPSPRQPLRDQGFVAVFAGDANSKSQSQSPYFMPPDQVLAALALQQEAAKIAQAIGGLT
jgi:hypothetical protein